MKGKLCFLGNVVACLFAVSAVSLECWADGASPAAAAKPASWCADNGNGTYSNPLFYEEFSDPDVIRVGEDYYLTGTTMHAMPGLPVLHSKDLVNWELASYCFDRLDLAPAFHLEGGEIYGQGIWAPCIRFHNGMFYIFANVNNFGTQVFRSASAAGPWQHNRLQKSLHDLSVLFDDDGKTYVVFGATKIQLAELNDDLTELVPGTQREILGKGMGEGLHFYKIRGRYYIVSAMPGGHTDMVVARADSLAGPWQIETMVKGESLGVPTQSSLAAGGTGGAARFRVQTHDPNEGGGLTLHQGGMVDTPSGQWWAILMQDHGSIGRLSCLVPVTWKDEFPFVGLPGNLRKAPNTWLKPDTGGKSQDGTAPRPLFVRSDAFDGERLNPLWQWNHMPDDSKWSLAEKPGVLRLHALSAADFWTARNTLTQRAIGPESIATVEVAVDGMKPGDAAGLALLNRPYAWIGVVKSAEALQLAVYDQTTDATTAVPFAGKHVWLRAACDFDTEKAVFSWSADGSEFHRIGGEFSMVFQLKTFQGVRYALFNYSGGGAAGDAVAGGFVDFDNFVVDEPRAAGVDRSIPVGKTITLTSVADGSLLAVGEDGATVGNVGTDSAEAASGRAHFKVIDLGRGRIALQASDGRLLTVTADEGAIGLIQEKGAGHSADASDAESFQWVNLLRGHVMLMSVANDRYLFATPHELGTVAAASTGPRPDRKDGACFTWKVVE